jgi:hypothetical protein
MCQPTPRAANGSWAMLLVAIAEAEQGETTSAADILEE